MGNASELISVLVQLMIRNSGRCGIFKGPRGGCCGGGGRFESVGGGTEGGRGFDEAGGARAVAAAAEGAEVVDGGSGRFAASTEGVARLAGSLAAAGITAVCSAPSGFAVEAAVLTVEAEAAEAAGT